MAELNSLTPTQDERVMAALSHASALIPVTGIIAPILIWMFQKDKSRYVAYQALQALAFQLVMIAAWFLGMGCYLCSTFSIYFPLFFIQSNPADGILLSLLSIFLPFLVFGIILLGGIVFILYGLAGAVFTLQGKPFRYVIIGNRIERFLQHQPEVSATGEE